MTEFPVEPAHPGFAPDPGLPAKESVLATSPRPATRRRRGRLAWLGDARGLTFLGAALLAGGAGTIGGVINARSAAWVGPVFATWFIAGCVLAALMVHREDLLTVAVMTPLLYFAITVGVGIVQAETQHKSLGKQVGLSAAYALSFGASNLWYATAATVAAVLIRVLVVHRPARSRPAGPGPHTAAAPTPQSTQQSSSF